MAEDDHITRRGGGVVVDHQTAKRWLGPEPDPHDLLSPLPSEPMTMWPISKRVNSPANDDEDLLTEIAVAEQGNWQ